jgi:hypothetical protein
MAIADMIIVASRKMRRTQDGCWSLLPMVEGRNAAPIDIVKAD